MSSKQHTSRSSSSQSSGGSSSGHGATEVGGNAEMQDALQGPAGRVFARILEAADIDVSVHATFGQQALREYLDETLQFAEGEFLRGTKLDGGADGMFAELDTNRDGQVGWSEFSALTSTLVETLVPEAQGGQISERDIIDLAEKQFDAVPGSGDGVLSYQELKRYTEAHLPDDTDHRGLVAQLSSRLAIDALDTDTGGGGRDVTERTISRQEWVRAAVDMALK